MKTKLKIDLVEARMYQNFLEEAYDEYKGCTDFYEERPFAVIQTDGGYEIILDKDFSDYLVAFDHSCTASPEDGCSFCYMLMELGLIEDRDYELEEVIEGE